ncbi:MAG: NADP-dependent isocitrate dehydrogenase [Trueperaceae bacterium]|nr:NADP-dependent isocitrate dehydrogenase [Trueperaceae bacterium]
MNQTLEKPTPATPVKTAVTVAPGDGIGPEITDATLRILKAAGAPLDYHTIEIGKAVYERGVSSGIPADAWNSIRTNRVLLKGPITTPQGGGYKSLNVTLRKALGLFANVRQAKAYTPFVASQHPDMNVVIIRENEEDLYAGIEHQQTREVAQILKLITRPGCEKIVRYAFEYARAYGRDRVTCMSKDNIMKLTDGLFHRVFDEIAAEYPDIGSDHQIIDIGAARLATDPESFDVIVTLNLYGDILSDITAQLAGSVGLAGSANIGTDIAMFEAIHGSAPDIAGQGIANPSGMLLAAVQMLVHLGHGDVAETINNAWLKTLEDGIHTGDIYRDELSQERVGTDGFADAVIARLGKTPEVLEPVHYTSAKITVDLPVHDPEPKELVGVDVFIDWSDAERDPNVIGNGLEAAAATAGWSLQMITNRGIKVYPEGLPETFKTDHWRCRFETPDDVVDFGRVLELYHAIHDAGFEIIKTEQLYRIGGQPAYSLGQGQ